ncbi:PucR family transcriptional regulator [Oceanobacillus profundus]|uniref:PucR family transcriptional regulator n=2 Tax=Oceanobacillus TaxID=182709 RepID=UPI000BA67822|nr:helix-turn-helix domain-containing protein [Oceanobacillus profundus]MDO6451397.1 helix-turn-helix domain-containing protein [Oceanobacillus profundus]PAE30761.1 hypothetical protein CHI07_02295 [Paenibacillus sp. 7884-2]
MRDKTNHLELLKSRMNEEFDSADQLADWIGEIFECPITIEDSNHHVVSYSKHKENIDEARIGTIMNRKVPDNVINGLWKKGVMSKLIDQDEAVVIPQINEIGLGNRVAISIREKNEILGFIWAHTGNKKLGKDELELLQEVAKQVRKLFFKHPKRNRKSEESYNDLFWQLLTGQIKDTDKLNQQAKQLNVQLEGELAVVVIRFEDQITEQIEKYAYYLAETQLQVKSLFRLFDSHEFIVLVRHHRKKEDPAYLLGEFIKQIIEKISNQLALKNVNGSAGIFYGEAKQINESYKQALSVLNLKEKYAKDLKGIYLYEDLGVYQFIEELFAIQKASKSRKNKYIERLRSYDKKHHTSLTDSLQAYLNCDCNVYQTAKELFIHPNTMNYRLKRIREVAILDLKDPKQKTLVYLDFIMERMHEG